MSGIRRFIICAAFCRVLAGFGQNPGELANRLDLLAPYQAKAEYEVLLPSAAEPVHYSIDFLSYIPEQADSLAPCNYLIRWQLYSPGHSPQTSSKPDAEGFSAYFDGHHYRHRTGERLQEYHTDWDPAPLGAGTKGVAAKDAVQNNAQFTELLPQYVAQQLRHIAADTSHVCTIKDNVIRQGRKCSVVKGVERSRGYDMLEYEYVFDSDTGTPIARETVTSPGSISEQEISVRYEYPASASDASALLPLTEEKLIALYPQVFGTMRQSNFRVENLRDSPLPAFSLPTVDGKRHTYNRGDTFAAPTLIVFLDTEIADGAKIVADVRSALSALPFSANVIWAFSGNHAPTIEEITGTTSLPEETVATSARTFARDCGITSYPTIIFCNTNGIIKDVQIGVNKDLASIVIQKTMLIQ